MGRVGFDPRSFSPWDGRSPVSHPTRHVPFPPRRTGEDWKGMIPARPLYPGVWESVWDPEPPSCVLPKGVPQGQTESGVIVLPPYAGPRAPNSRCHPAEALYLPTFSHLLIVNKLLSLLSLSPSPSCLYIRPLLLGSAMLSRSWR